MKASSTIGDTNICQYMMIIDYMWWHFHLGAEAKFIVRAKRFHALHTIPIRLGKALKRIGWLFQHRHLFISLKVKMYLGAQRPNSLSERWQNSEGIPRIQCPRLFAFQPNITWNVNKGVYLGFDLQYWHLLFTQYS